MDNAQKAIMIGVGLFITIIIISAVLLVVNLGTGLMNDATSELGSISGVLRGQILDNYDGKTKTGSEILAAVRQYSNSDTVSIIIDNAGTKYYVGAGYLTLPGTPEYKIGGIQNGSVSKDAPSGHTSGKATYSSLAGSIPSQKYYKTAVVYDNEGNVIGIAVKQQ